MIEAIADEITDGWMLGKDSSINEDELQLLRNRIWISWMIWFLASSAIATGMTGLPGQDWTWNFLVGAFFAFQLTRLMRAYRRPKLGKWHLRRHLYKLSYFLPPMLGGLAAGFSGRPASIGGWLSFLSTLYLLYLIQMKDDIKILKAIPLAIKHLRQNSAVERI